MKIYDEHRCLVPLLKRVVDEIGMSFNDKSELIFCTFTEYRNDRGVLLRCHPDYRGSGPWWYDWVTIQEVGEKKNLGRLIAMVDGPYTDRHHDIDCPYWAIVKPMLPNSMSYHVALVLWKIFLPTGTDLGIKVIEVEGPVDPRGLASKSVRTGYIRGRTGCWV